MNDSSWLTFGIVVGGNLALDFSFNVWTLVTYFSSDLVYLLNNHPLSV